MRFLSQRIITAAESHVTPRKTVHKVIRSTEGGLPQCGNCLTEIEQVLLRGEVQHSERAGHRKPSLSCHCRRLSLIDEYQLGLQLLGQTDGFCFAQAKGKGSVNVGRGENL